MSRFVDGLAPAVAVLMFYVAAKLVGGGLGGSNYWAILMLGAASLIGYVKGAPPPLVLLSAGALGVLLLR